jgi:non-ribosomal peptide synthetase component E (peptide arylation enzyme)
MFAPIRTKGFWTASTITQMFKAHVFPVLKRTRLLNCLISQTAKDLKASLLQFAIELQAHVLQSVDHVMMKLSNYTFVALWHL